MHCNFLEHRGAWAGTLHAVEGLIPELLSSRSLQAARLEAAIHNNDCGSRLRRTRHCERQANRRYQVAHNPCVHFPSSFVSSDNPEFLRSNNRAQQ